MQEVRLRQVRRLRKTLRAVQGKTAAILERPQEGRRRSRWRVAGGYCWREDEEEINYFIGIKTKSLSSLRTSCQKGMYLSSSAM